MKTVIKVTNVSKDFKVYRDKGTSLKEKILFWKRNRYEVRHVLKNISFEVKAGEVLALVGQNGCGKSTTLKLLTRILYPDSGSIEIHGRVASLIELGAGFHPDMSGRENIYINASIFGLTKKEIDARLDDIIAFSELEDFIDNPVRTYSSGMYMRLAFAVAINVDADILLIDEILAVGDANFQAKCYERLRELKASGVTIVIVTHDTGTVERFCNQAIWINKGEIVKSGPAVEVVDSYLKYMNDQKMQLLLKEERRQKKKEEAEKAKLEKQKADIPPSLQEEKRNESRYEGQENIDYNANHFGLQYVTIEQVTMRNGQNEKADVIKAGGPMYIDIYYKVNRPLPEFVVGMGFNTMEGNSIYGNNTQLDNIHVMGDKPNGRITFEIPKLPLLSGKYGLNIAIVDWNGVPMDFYREYCQFSVVSNDRSAGVVSIDHQWNIEQENQ